MLAVLCCFVGLPNQLVQFASFPLSVFVCSNPRDLQETSLLSSSVALYGVLRLAVLAASRLVPQTNFSNSPLSLCVCLCSNPRDLQGKKSGVVMCCYLWCPPSCILPCAKAGKKEQGNQKLNVLGQAFSCTLLPLDLDRLVPTSVVSR